MSLIKQYSLSSSEFRNLKILSENYILDSIKAGELQDDSSYDMVALFKILTQGDQSVFFDKKAEAEKIDTLEMDLETKLEFCFGMEASEMLILEDCVFHVFDPMPEAYRILNILGA